MSYLPNPPRAWSRVQNKCTYTSTDFSYNQVYIPLTNQIVSPAQANYEDKLIYKGNILQYKGNTSRLTKKQKYSQLSKGFGPNRTKVFATQSQTYTNPNTYGLVRVNYDEFIFPNQLVGEPNNISGPFQYNVPNPYDCSSNVIKDGGNLVCGTYENPCTGEIIKTSSTEPKCFPTYCSDVPGEPQLLCWNPKVQTWFPRQRYIMSNSGNKWPQGYKGFVSAYKPGAPYLMVVSSTYNTITLSWSIVKNVCLPISSFNIFKDGILYQNVPYTDTTIVITGLNSNTLYSFFVTALSSNIESSPSNTVFGKTCDPYLNTPVLSGTPVAYNTIDLSWNYTPVIINPCDSISGFDIYQDTILIQNVSSSTTNLPITGLTGNTDYSYNIVAISSVDPIFNVSSNIINITTCNPYLNAPDLSYNNITTTTVNLSWNYTPVIINPCESISGFDIYQNGVFYTNVSSSTTNLPITGLTKVTDYSYNVVALSSIDSIFNVSSNIINFTTYPIYSVTGNPTINISGNNYKITYDASGTITFYDTAVTSLNGVLVGGGGFGAWGSPDSGPGNNRGGGGGGGAESITFSTNDISLYHTNNIIIGNGGINNANAATNVLSADSIIQFSSSSYTAFRGIDTGGNPGGNGGESGVNGGIGGVGGTTKNGDNGTNYTHGTDTYYGGGGGGQGENDGGGSNISGGGGGGIAYDLSSNVFLIGGIGGIAGGNGTGGPNYGGLGGANYGGNGGNGGYDGLDGKYGGGGGGGGGISSNYRGKGGKGGNGLCVIKFTSPS